VVSGLLHIPSTHWLDDWVGPRASLDAVVKRDPCPCQELNTGHPAHSLVIILTELSWLHFTCKDIIYESFTPLSWYNVPVIAFKMQVLRSKSSPLSHCCCDKWNGQRVRKGNVEQEWTYTSQDYISCCLHAWGDEKCMQGFGQKTWRQSPLTRPRCRLEDVRMDMRDTGCRGMAWMPLGQDRDQWWAVVNMVMNLRVL